MNLQSSNVIVNAGCLLFFNDVPRNSDILDSTLYVQLAASRKYSRFTEYAQWKQTWLDAAFYLGWEFRASQNFEQPAPCAEAATFWDWAKALRPAFVSERLLERSEKALQRCPLQQSAFTIFSEQILAPGAAGMAMQMGLIDQDDSLTLVQLYFESTGPLQRDDLFGPWAPERVKGNIELSFHRLLLSSDSFYKPRREVMFAKLEGRRAGLVSPVQRLRVGS